MYEELTRLGFLLMHWGRIVREQVLRLAGRIEEVLLQLGPGAFMLLALMVVVFAFWSVSSRTDR
jgi:hypothetical protein